LSDLSPYFTKTNIALFVFDVLYFNGKNLLKETLDVRKAILRDHFPKDKIMNRADGKLYSLKEENFAEKIDDFFTVSTREGFEGLIIKALGPKTFYDTKGRTQWVKLKKNIEGKGLADTIDLVPIAGYYGKVFET